MLMPRIARLEKLKRKIRQIRERGPKTKEQLSKTLTESEVQEILAFLAKNFSYKEIEELTGWNKEIIKTLLKLYNINYKPSISPRHKTLYFLKKPLAEIVYEILNSENGIVQEIKKIQQHPEHFKTLYYRGPKRAGYILAYLAYIKHKSSIEVAETLRLKHKTTVLNMFKQLGLVPLGKIKQRKQVKVSQQGIAYAQQIAQEEGGKLEKLHQQIVEEKITYQQIVDQDPQTAEKLVIHMYWNKKQSIKTLAKLYKKDYRTLRKILEKHGLTTRPKRKYDKRPFTGDIVEEAYIYGLALGDITLRKHRKTKAITAALSTPKPAMIKLFKETFQKYTEAIWIQPKRTVRNNKEYYEWRLTAYLDRSFEKLIPDKNRIPQKYLQYKEALYSLLAALTDCEGSIVLRPDEKVKLVHLVYKLGMASRNIIETIYKRMLELHYKAHLYIESTKNTRLGKKPMYVIRLYGRNAYKLLQRISPYMKHAERLERIKLYQHYMELRRTQGKTKAYEIIKKELEKLKKRIEEETRKSREKAKEQYQKRKTQPLTFFLHHHTLLKIHYINIKEEKPHSDNQN